MLTKLTPNLFVDSVEAQLPFWVDTLGFERTVSVPESKGSDKLGFVILVSGLTEVMIQTWGSIEADIGWKDRVACSSLFIETDNIYELEERVSDLPKVIERRTTFYGATEIGVRDPAGNLVIFAQFGKMPIEAGQGNEADSAI